MTIGRLALLFKLVVIWLDVALPLKICVCQSFAQDDNLTPVVVNSYDRIVDAVFEYIKNSLHKNALVPSYESFTTSSNQFFSIDLLWLL